MIRRIPFPAPCAARLLLGGHMLLLAALCGLVIALDVTTPSAALRALDTLEAAGGTLGASAVILWGAALGMDWMERRGG